MTLGATTVRREEAVAGQATSLRIAIDARCILPHNDGLGTYARNLLGELANLTSPHRFLALVQPGALDELRHLEESGRVELVPLAAASMKLSQQLRVPWKLRELGPDIYHYLVHDLPFLHRVPSLLTLQDLNFLLFPNYYGRFSLLKRAYSRAVVRVALTRVAHVIVPSTATREGLLARWPGLDGRVSVIPHGLDPRFLQLPDRARVDSVLARYRLRWHGYFFFLGTDRPHKNLARLVRAFEDLPAEIRFRAPLVLAGAHRYGSRGGSSRDRAEVVQLGYVPVEELPALYHASLAVVLPSFGEGFGLPALEAMASGAALIASNHGAFPELVGDGGLLVDPCSPDSIRNAMENVATRPEVRGQLSLRGRKRSQQFRFEETARSTLALYQQVGAGTP